MSKEKIPEKEKNLCNKKRPLNDPYEIWISHDGTWEYRVLRKYQKPTREKANAYARWLVAAHIPMTSKSPYPDRQATSFALGDMYVSEITQTHYKVHYPKEYIRLGFVKYMKKYDFI